MSLAERLAPYAPNVQASWTDEVERWLGTMGDAGSTWSVGAVKWLGTGPDRSGDDGSGVRERRLRIEHMCDGK